ncbi:MAG: twin-arginine translocation signal domain-containing protein, partial [Halobaculum sp.]
MARTRRGLLALLAAGTGCLGFGGSNQVTPGDVETSPGAETATDTPSPTAPPTAPPSETPTATGTPSPTRTNTPTDTATPTDTVSPTPTRTREAQAPPEGSLTLGEVTLTVEERRRTAQATVTVSLSASGDVTFTLIELRVDLYYETPFGGRRQVGTGYIVAEDEEGVSGTIEGTISFDDPKLDGSEPDSRYSVDLQYRRVRY